MRAPPKKPIPPEFKGGRHLYAIEENQNLDIEESAIMSYLAARCDLGEKATFEDEKKHSRKDIAKKCKLSLAVIERRSKQLAEKGYIVLTANFKESGGQDSNSYRLTRKVFDEYLAGLTDAPPRLGDDPLHNYLHNNLAHENSDHPYDPQASSISQENHQVERQIISEGVALIEGNDSRESKQEFMKEVIGDLCLENQAFLSVLKGLRTKQVFLPNDSMVFKQIVTNEIEAFHLQKACRRKYVKKRSSVRQP